MISKTTITSLQLPHHTIRSCRDLYEELAQSSQGRLSMQRTLSQCESDAQALNKLWWVLNYHSESFDTNRKLRAWVEVRLEKMATEKNHLPPLQS